MNIDQLIDHLQDIREFHGRGDLPVLAHDECGELIEFKEQSVYSYNPAMAGVKVVIDA